MQELWLRIVAVISRGQAERESWVIQAWARLASMPLFPVWKILEVVLLHPLWHRLFTTVSTGQPAFGVRVLGPVGHLLL